ncbi:5-oxoprolinase subunit PxpB [Robertkochia sediminum]|uniref:5-oxoprolinase subunit PxpB n=1 Tax=Robertkochia sediminum TaxID=2785326 RepID=UPI0019345473|nr:5-oxoprolinase subunit PxpB [Robertkochia sediminum]MBL7473372.1 5-oxoprolinase subunit PxpB [Robertkochia sediminum]
MQNFELKYRPFGERALLIEWPEEISENILTDIMAFSRRIAEAMPTLERVPAYNSLTLISREPMEAEDLTAGLRKLYDEKSGNSAKKRKLWNIPVCYEAPFCQDLEEIAQASGTSPEAIIEGHTQATYTVYAIGFLPGFMYLGGLPEALHFPRRESPRPKVAAGSVGIGGKQTGIYPQESPGGWNIIGNSPIKIFNAENDPPCGISVGDKIRFYAIDKDMHELFTIQVDSGVFQIKTLELDDQSA